MAVETIKQLRDFPSVEELLQSRKLTDAINSVPRPVAAELVKKTVARAKAEFKSSKAPLTVDHLIDRIKTNLTRVKVSEISNVINATGVIVHTNLGRAPLSEAMFDAIKTTVVGYGNIEFDVHRGVRGSRGEACEKYLALLAGSESATVVNNCAASLFMILNTLSNRKGVIISRGELVQIGGGFRIPGILKKAGARLCEVGTTNITTASDYEAAIDNRTGLILKVHQSNFVQRGFVEEALLKELVALGKKHELPVINDLGSGVFVSTKEILGYAEPTVQQSVRQGVDLTSFSGDKMLGGVQAGIIVGRKDLIAKVKKNPLFRTVRVDKVVLSMLEKLCTIYLNGTYRTDIKLWSLLCVAESELYQRGKSILKEIGEPAGISVEATKAFIGGGALPESDIPSVAIIFSTDYKANRLLSEFRKLKRPVIGRVESDRFILDLKAVGVEELSLLTSAIKKVLTRMSR